MICNPPPERPCKPKLTPWHGDDGPPDIDIALSILAGEKVPQQILKNTGNGEYSAIGKHEEEVISKMCVEGSAVPLSLPLMDVLVGLMK